MKQKNPKQSLSKRKGREQEEEELHTDFYVYKIMELKQPCHSLPKGDKKEKNPEQANSSNMPSISISLFQYSSLG